MIVFEDDHLYSFKKTDNIQSLAVLFDKLESFNTRLQLQEDNIKIIVLVRDMEEVLASFIKFTNRQPNSRFNSIAHTIEDKCNILLTSIKAKVE